MDHQTQSMRLYNYPCARNFRPMVAGYFFFIFLMVAGCFYYHLRHSHPQPVGQ